MKRKHSMSEECFDSIMAKAQETGEISKGIESSSENKQESDKDSDYGGSDYDTGEATTFRMLFEKTQVSDIEFVDCCQQVGLVSSSQTCECGSSMCLSHSDSQDGVEWKCSSCSKQRALREGTWLEEAKPIRLKDVILVLYCWARNYPENLCQHEIDLSEASLLLIPILYKKCKKLCTEYFEDEVSNIGCHNEIVEILLFITPIGVNIIGGIEKSNMKNVFFNILPQNWNRDDVCTVLADNVASGTTIHCHSSHLTEILSPLGIKYLDKVWNLKVIPSETSESPAIPSMWALFEKVVVDKDYTQETLVEFLFRRRMEVHRDPFLFLLNIIALLHPPATTSRNSSVKH